MLRLPSLTTGLSLSTVALVVSAAVVLLPALSVAVTETLRLLASILPPPSSVKVKVAVQVSLLLLATTAPPPPNWLKSTVTLLMVSLLLSPPAVLFQVAVTVSPTMKAPPVPLAPLMLILPSVTTGLSLSTVALLVSAVVSAFEEVSVAVTETLRLVASILPPPSSVRVKVAVQVSLLLLAATAAPPPNWLKSTVTEATSLLLSPPAVLFQVAVTVSPTIYAPPVPLAPLIEMLASVIVGGVESTRPVSWELSTEVNPPELASRLKFSLMPPDAV